MLLPSKLIGQEQFEVFEAFGLEQAQFVSLNIDRTPGKRVKAELMIEGINYMLDLRPHSIRTNDFRLVTKNRAGEYVEIEPEAPRTVRGSLIGSEGSIVAGSVLESGLSAKVMMGDGRVYFVEPVASKFANSDVTNHVLYEPSDIKPHNGRCSIANVPKELAVEARKGNKGTQSPSDHRASENGPDNKGLGRGTGSGGTPQVAEIAFDCDHFFTDNQGGNPLPVMESIINTMNTQFENQVGITHVLTFVIQRAFADGTYTSFDPQVFLTQVRNEWMNDPTLSIVRRDVVHMFTGEDRDAIGSTIGVAWNSGICSANDTGYAWSQSFWAGAGNLACATNLSAHELGHSWSANHCSCPSNTMNATATTQNCTNNFSNSTRQTITNYRDSVDCLNNTHWVNPDFATPQPRFWDLAFNWSITPNANLRTIFDRDVETSVQWRNETGDSVAGSVDVKAGTVVFDANVGSETSHTAIGNVEVGPSTSFGVFRLKLTATNTIDVESIMGVSTGADVTSTEGVIDGTNSLLLVNDEGSWTNTSNLNVGLFETGEMSVEFGGTVSAAGGRLGNGAGSAGTATVTGIGSRWDNTVDLVVGNNGNGTLTVDDSGVVTAGVGYIGSQAAGFGTATVSNDAELNCDELLLGGLFASDGGVGHLDLNSSGEVSVGNDFISAPGTKLAVGDSGFIARMAVRNGSTISNDGQSQIGGISGRSGEVLVHGTGSNWSNAANLNVGLAGTGVLNIEAGGTVSAAGGRLGNGAGSTGTATVTGSGSRWDNTVDLLVGNNGNGTLTVDDGGVVNAGVGYIGIQAGSNGTATIAGAGSQWNMDALYIGGSTTQPGGDATLNISSGGEVNVSGLTTVWPTSTLNLEAGSLSSGELNLETGASVDIRIDGVGLGSFGRFTTSSETTFGGNLNVTLGEEFILEPGQQFLIADVGGTAMGQFDNLSEGDVVGSYNGVELIITYAGGDGNDVELYTQSTVILGDVNMDGAVNLLDISPFIDLISSGGFQPEADINQDGQVNLLDIGPFVTILSGG